MTVMVTSELEKLLFVRLKKLFDIVKKQLLICNSFLVK